LLGNLWEPGKKEVLVIQSANLKEGRSSARLSGNEGEEGRVSAEGKEKELN